MIEAYTVQAIRETESRALAVTPEHQLMKLAAHRVAHEVARHLPEPHLGRRVTLLVGAGNNGGDALFAGAYLRRRGVSVTAVLAAPDRTHQAGLAAFLRAGGNKATDVPADTQDVIVDGLVGIGARPPLRDRYADLVEWANAADATRIAVDVPSGIDPDTGAVAGQAFQAHLTVTFGGYKQGLLLADDYAGEVVVAELGLTPPKDRSTVGALTDADVAALVPVPGRGSDKFSEGVVGIVAGSEPYPGAAVLSSGAAVRLRPGLVRYAGPAAHQVLARWPEVVACAEPEQAGRVQAWVVGPGMGTDDAARTRLAAVLGRPEPVLVDADGLTLLAAYPQLLHTRETKSTVLTPHAGEFARLFPDLDPTDRLGSVRAAAARTEAIVLLKGHRTLVAAPDGRVLVNTTGSSWLATAGSGDILSGVIGSLLAAGLPPQLAAAAGAHLHGRAGERAERDQAAGATALWNRLRPIPAEA